MSKAFHLKLWGLLLLLLQISCRQSFEPLILSDHLVINEIFIDTTHATYGHIGYIENSWIEVFNPTTRNMTLQGLHDGMTRTPNLLLYSEAPRGRGFNVEINIKPFGYVIICSDKERFRSNWEVPEGTQVFSGLHAWLPGGVLRIWGVDENLKKVYDDVRYGPIFPELKVECINSMDFTDNRHSLSRLPNGFDTNDCARDFKVTTPTPGRENTK